jgi:hypothetical protein
MHLSSLTFDRDITAGLLIAEGAMQLEPTISALLDASSRSLFSSR